MSGMTTGQKAMDEAHYKCRAVRMERDKLKADRQELLAALEASKKLCAVYFQIAASVVGEDKVREIRDEAITAWENVKPPGPATAHGPKRQP